MKNYDLSEVLAAAKGRWVSIYLRCGIPEQYLKNAHGPCPFCAGKDRFRFDDKDGSGSVFCNQCDATGDGLHVVRKWMGWTSPQYLPKALSFIVNELGSPFSNLGQSQKIEEEQKQKFALELSKKIWSESMALDSGHESPLVRYLKNRGIARLLATEALRFHASLDYFESGKSIGKFPVMIAQIKDVDGNHLGIHRTYLNPNGTKAEVSTPKMTLGKIGGGAVKFDDPDLVLHVAEGIETALAVRDELEVPTWAATSAVQLEKLEVPPSVSEVHIWADLDRNGRGGVAADILAHRLYKKGITAFVHFPVGFPLGDTKSVDWLDVYRFTRGQR